MNISINYYKGGLAITPYKQDKNKKILYDELRAFVIVKFDYQTDKGVVKASQCFYRSTGSNSCKQFGEHVSNKEARGTWIPTNVIVVNLTLSGKNRFYQELIYKPPFVVKEGTLLSRFGGDKQLALVSYALGGGIWDVSQKVTQLKNLFPGIKLLQPGYANLNSEKLVKASYKQVNYYIGKNNSYNWRPVDEDFKKLSGLKVVDFTNDIFWIKVQNRCFIPIGLLSPINLKNIIGMTKKYGKNVGYRSVINLFLTYKWTNPEIFYLCDEKSEKVNLSEKRRRSSSGSNRGSESTKKKKS